MVAIPPNVFADAVREFWLTRESQGKKQQERGQTDQGARSEVTGGQQMNGFVKTIVELMVQAGVLETDIYSGQRLTNLPGYFRPMKAWDIVVVSNGQLVAAIELKSQVGPSFGNNFNNRTEEALGSAEDLWTAYREGAFQSSPQPWLGYLLLLEDSEASRRPLKIGKHHFKVFDEFRDTSYARRYEIFCRKLVRERKYSAACFLLADRSRAHLPVNYTEPARDLSAPTFLTDLIRHVCVAL